ncbi:HET-domain-containing protein [Lizonia empirigonia]|nr:HET-domain-containing protein [Lizonia empirigonia]
MLTAEYAGKYNDSTPVGRPILTESVSLPRSTLLRGWLRWCDEGHEDCGKPRAQPVTVLPTRLLDVGNPGEQDHKLDIVHLVCGTDATTQQYVALSHCWGQIPEEDMMMFCTTQGNIDRRQRGFDVSELPKTFQDAITVTREIGVRYIWIDSLCIIQYGDDKADWKIQSRLMESVFSQAYCTIAATAAVDSKAGFLMRDVRFDSVYVRDTSGNEFYVSNDIDDFDKHVGKAKLNTRAWVMQEAVLSRRIIHFSANQVYWECGKGVYCENFVMLERYFTLDSNFPKRMLISGRKRTLNCISYLVQEYSKRDLTVPTDRRVAISALEDRIKDALNKRYGRASNYRSSRYGIFRDFLHRNLLWRADDCQLKKIEHEPPLPSWTWMAYSGGVKFIDVAFGYMEWIDSIRFDEERGDAIIATLWMFQEGAAKEKIHFDLGEGDILGEQYCVVVGKTIPEPGYADNDPTSTEYHILVVVSTDVDGEYRRVGAGTVHCSHVVRQRAGVRVV